MGRGTQWLHVENNALIDVWLVATNVCIRGTDQSGNVFWENALTKWRHRLRDVAEGRSAHEGRGKEALRKQWGKLLAGVMEFSSYYLTPKELKPKGNVSEKDLINMAVSLFCGESTYTRMRGDYAEDLKLQTTKKRRAKQILCPYVPYWRKLRDEPKLKAAAAAYAASQKKGAATKAAAAERAAAMATKKARANTLWQH